MMRRGAVLALGVVAFGCAPDAPAERAAETEQSLSLETKLEKPSPEVGAFGIALAMSGNRAVVGDSSHGNSPNAKRGGAWVFELGASGWALDQELLPADGPGGNKAFGSQVAIDGDTVVVSEPGDFDVHVFGNAGGQWVQEAAIQHTPSQQFSVAVSGDTLVFGAPEDWNGTSYSGRGHVYRKTAGTWALEQILVVADPGADGVGTSVAIQGDTVVLGAPGGGGDDGAAYVFTRSGAIWTEQAALEPGVSGMGLFGSAVALDGDTAVVGAHIVGASGGRAQVFVRSGTTWTSEQTLTQPGLQYFGQSVAIDQDTLAVGAPHASPNGTNSGAVYTFARSGTTWSPLLTIVPGDTVANDWFGHSTALVGDRVAASAPFQDISIGQTGAVYVYDLTSQGGAACTTGVECASGYCVDGVCCDTPCGGGVADCEACSVTQGAANDGVCAAVAAGTSCDDGDACTTGDQCQGATCVPGPDTCGAGGAGGSAGVGGGAGVGGSAGIGGSAGGAVGGSAGTSAAPGASDSGGCGCRTAGARGERGYALLILFGVAFARRRATPLRLARPPRRRSPS